MDNNNKKGAFERFQDYLDTAKGRTLLNYLYSWGAAIVILGALFKLTHISGADLMLFLGMGTEVLVFIISGFEKPFIPNQDDEDDYTESAPAIRGGNIIITQGQPIQPTTNNIQEQPAVTSIPVQGVEPNASSLNVDGVELVTANYLERVKDLTEKMERICRQSEKMEQSAEELETLTRNLISINTFYQMQLRSASTQMDNMDRASEQTRNMVFQIEELNRVYARMVEAMKVNIGTKEQI